jgi:hypothetical protein
MIVAGGPQVGWASIAEALDDVSEGRIGIPQWQCHSTVTAFTFSFLKA